MRKYPNLYFHESLIKLQKNNFLVGGINFFTSRFYECKVFSGQTKYSFKLSFLETILGVKIGALQNEAEQYVSSLHRLLDVAMSRIWKFWQWPDFIFHSSKTYRENLQYLRIAHGFSRRIIKEKKLSYINREMREGSRRPKCLLDVLLKLHMEDKVLDEEGVRQEVDTFIAAVAVFEIPQELTLSVSSFLVQGERRFRSWFDPERFLPENSAHIPECAYIPFLTGPRSALKRCELNHTSNLHMISGRGVLTQRIGIIDALTVMPQKTSMVVTRTQINRFDLFPPYQNPIPLIDAALKLTKKNE
ncbi:cytochrome P450 4V2 [Caerostris darwini]|uniref:Cytochrome P450 4V2 n=1 Tax=Caerostris darwini TaxID=1538125 RepID=A0AAV4S975_9ARAC|nr:cytochrome P450 4V2 [Caerostris darwini]